MSNTPKSEILIGHVADTHLRDTQYGTPKRGEDFFQGFKNAIKAGLKEVDMYVLVGDIFDKSRPSSTVVKQIMEIDAMLVKNQMKMLAVTGNHDWCKQPWVDTLFGGRTSDSYGIIPIDDKTMTVFGFVFTGVVTHNASSFREALPEIEKQAKGADVVLFHGFVDGIVPMYAGSKNPLHVDELPIAQTNEAWLLGDIHVQGYVDRPRPDTKNVLIGYPGSTEMCSSGEATQKSLPCIKVSKDAAQSAKFINYQTRKFISETIKTPAELDALIATIEKCVDEEPVVRIDYDRSLPNVVMRIHAVLDPQKCVIRCYPLPMDKEAYDGEGSREVDENQLTMEDFIRKKFDGNPRLTDVALDLLYRGAEDAHNIINDFIDAWEKDTSIREDKPPLETTC